MFIYIYIYLFIYVYLYMCPPNKCSVRIPVGVGGLHFRNGPNSERWNNSLWPPAASRGHLPPPTITYHPPPLMNMIKNLNG